MLVFISDKDTYEDLYSGHLELVPSKGDTLEIGNTNYIMVDITIKIHETGTQTATIKVTRRI